MSPERWLVISVRAPSHELVDELAGGLVALGGTAVEEDADLLTTYVLPPNDPAAFVREAYGRLQALAPNEALELVWRWQLNEDWEHTWRRGLRPRRVGERLVVTPSWIEPQHRPGDVVLVIDPKMAFGTGEHATTRGVLRLLEPAVRSGDRVVDVGTGSGILAIAAVRLGAAQVLAVEMDGAALENAVENVERNGAIEHVRLEHARVDRAFLEALGPARFDLILANVLSTVLEPLLSTLHDVLAPGGRLILGGILEEEMSPIVESARCVRLELHAEAREGEWWSGLFERAPVAG